MCLEHKFGFYLISCSFFSEILFFGDTYANLLDEVLLVKNDCFVEIPFSAFK